MNLQQLVASNEASVRHMQTMAPMLSEWFSHELMVIHSQMPQRNGGLLMGCPVWGDDYIRRMLLYSLPTLGTDANINALRDRCWLVLYSRAADRPYIWKMTRWLRQMGIHTIFRDIPEDLLKLAVIPEARYGLLGATQNILAHMAGHAGMGLHMYMPDHLYEAGYFESLMRLREQHDAIVQLGVSVNAATVRGPLQQFRDPSGALVLPGVALGDLALEHMHDRSAKLMLNGADFPNELPDSQQWIWKGRDAVHLAGASQNPVYIAPHLCLDAPVAFTSTLDMLHVEYIPAHDGVPQFYVPGPEDGMSFFEMSDENRIPVEGYANYTRWLYRSWSQVAFTDDYLPYLERRSLMPISPNEDGMEVEEIDRQHRQMMLMLRSGKREAMEIYFNGQNPARWERAA